MVDRQVTPGKFRESRGKNADDGDCRKNIQVVCRIKPLASREKDSFEVSSIEVLNDRKTVRIKSQLESAFAFDQVYPPETSQKQLFESIGLPTVKSVLEGFNGTILAYGQTSSGKTYTMVGQDISDPLTKGLIPRISKTIFEEIQESEQELEFSVKVSFCEIYLEKIRDLLNPRKTNLKISEDKTRGVFIKDLSEYYVASENEVFALLKLGNKQREVAGTLMNEESSRSHAIFMVTISQHNTQDLSLKTGKMFLVDLAGSEKLSKTAAEGKRLDETKNINKSLSSLGNVICALTDGKSVHVPYRDSKLTRVLSESLGGNSKTSLVVTVSSALINENETLSTLRFGLRAKAVKNKPVVNKELSVAELRLMLAQANEKLMKKDCKIKWLEEKIAEFSLDEEFFKKCKGFELPETFLSFDNGNNDKISELEKEVSSLAKKNTALAKENDILNGKVCYLNTLMEEYKERILELTDSLNMSKGKIDAQEKDLKLFEETNKKLQKLSDEFQEALQVSELSLKNLQIENKDFSTHHKNIQSQTFDYNLAECSKVMSLEKNLEQLNLMYQVLSNKCTTMKSDLFIYEKKTVRKNERIAHLEKLLKKAVEQVNHFKYKLEQACKDSEGNNQSTHPKIKRLIRGGSSANVVNILCPYSLNTTST